MSILPGSALWGMAADKKTNCDTKSLVEVVPTIKEGTARVTG